VAAARMPDAATMRLQAEMSAAGVDIVKVQLHLRHLMCVCGVQKRDKERDTERLRAGLIEWGGYE